VKRRFDRPPAPASRLVTSLTNETVKDIRALAMRKVREEAGLFVAEGLKLVADAIDGGWPIRILVHRSGEDKPMLARAIAATRRAGGDILEVTEEVLEKLSRRDNPQTVIGVFEQRLERIAGLEPSRDAVWIGLDRVRDPGNLGTIIRTADAVGAEGVMLIGETTDPFGLEAIRATMGSIFNVRLASGSTAEFLAWRQGWGKGSGGQVIGTHLAGTEDYRDADYRLPCLLLMGNEQQGLPDDLAAACDRLVKIPMRGRADSLNLAVATGVVLFELARSRRRLAPDRVSPEGSRRSTS
jgi:TrmH family RNA methyltransferase